MYYQWHGERLTWCGCGGGGADKALREAAELRVSKLEAIAVGEGGLSAAARQLAEPGGPECDVSGDGKDVAEDATPEAELLARNHGGALHAISGATLAM